MPWVSQSLTPLVCLNRFCRRAAAGQQRSRKLMSLGISTLGVLALPHRHVSGAQQKGKRDFRGTTEPL